MSGKGGVRVRGKVLIQEEDGRRDSPVTGDQTCALPISAGGGKGVSTRDKIKNDILKENQQLELNNKKLKDLIEKLQQSNDKLCCICYTDERNVVTLPCSHLIVCIKCYIRTSTSLDTGTKNARCSYCRRKVGAYTVIFQP